MDDNEAAALDRLQAELEILAASLLPAEHIRSSSDPPSAASPNDLQATTVERLPVQLEISSDDSRHYLNISVDGVYPAQGSVQVQVKAKDQGRDEAEGWREWVEGVMRDTEWDDSELGTPLYAILTDHFLPLLAPAEPDILTSVDTTPIYTANEADQVPHHVLIITHHLISPTKRKDLLHLSSSLNLVGFSKIGHPGILYATGSRDDLTEWLREVKSWNWLALRVRIAIEPIPDKPDDANDRGGKSTNESADVSRDKKARGDWVELEKLGEAMAWLGQRGREGILVDAGVGSRGA